MPNLGALITNVELCSKADGRSTVTFPTLKKLSSSDVDAVWSIVSQRVRQKLLKAEPQAVRIPGLGTFHIKRWLSFENGEVHTFQKPVFALSRTAAEIRELQHAAVPDKMKKVSVNYEKIQSKVLYAKDVVQETLKFFYFILRNREDTDFTLKGVGTLAIRGTEVTMAFCEDFLQSLNKSTYVVEKLLVRKWVTLDKEIPLLPSRFGRVHQFPQFEIRKVPRRASVTNDEIIQDFERALSSMGVRAAVRHTLHRLRRDISPDHLARAELQNEPVETMKGEGEGLPARLLPQHTGGEGKQDKETPLESPELTSTTLEEHRQAIQKRDSVFGMNSRRRLEASLAKMKEQEENGEAGRVTLPALPPEQARRASNGMQRAQLPQEEDDIPTPPETTYDTEEGRQATQAWIRERMRFRTELESLGDVKKWLSQKPSLTQQEERYLQSSKAAAKAAKIDSLNKGSLTEWVARSGPVDHHCRPSTAEVNLGELVDQHRKDTVTCYLTSSKRCKERHVRISDPKLKRALLHPGDPRFKEEDLRKTQQAGEHGTGRAFGSQAKKAEKRRPQNKPAKVEMPKLSDNRFWPGHLLDKLCLYFPEQRHDRAHALFSCVRPTKPSTFGI